MHEKSPQIETKLETNGQLRNSAGATFTSEEPLLLPERRNFRRGARG